MLFYQKFIVRKHERGLLFKDGDFLSFLAPATYRFFGLQNRYAVECFDVSQPAFNHRLVDYFLEAERDEVEQLFEVVHTGTDEAAVVYHNKQLTAVLGPDQRALYWKGLVGTVVERFDLSQGQAIDKRTNRQLIERGNTQTSAILSRAVLTSRIDAGHAGLLYIDGEFVRVLPAGVHAFWRFDQELRVESVDLRVRTLEVQGQEILTRDKVALRINVTATFQIVDAAKATEILKDPLDQLYKELQFGLRAAVGTRVLDVLLEDKTVIDREVAEFVEKRFADYGIDVRSVGVKDIILPGDMKELLGKVVEAEKAAQANVIRRREETNATRSLLNTAKVMESNSVALRLKELETLERVTENVGNLSVYGGLDSVMNGLVRLKQ
ncbi:MAG: slipin family protein [Granulosicoccus sp.]|nr:slipin family protein [Granulosicoccus sp.]